MKIKTILITAAVVIGAGAVTSFFVRRSHETNVKKVEVVPVTNINSASYGMGDMSTVSGTIISRDTQVVSLDSGHELKDVYVQQGDRVRKGDKLLEYDMLGDELKEEMEELTKMSLELNLEGMKRDLETLRSGRMPESLGGGSSPSAGAGDDDSGDDADSGFDDASDDDSDSSDPTQRTHAKVSKQGGGAVGAADTFSPRPFALAGAYALPAEKLSFSSDVWSSDDLLQRLQELKEYYEKNGLELPPSLQALEDGGEFVPEDLTDEELALLEALLSMDEVGLIVGGDSSPTDKKLVEDTDENDTNPPPAIPVNSENGAPKLIEEEEKDKEFELPPDAVNGGEENVDGGEESDKGKEPDQPVLTSTIGEEDPTLNLVEDAEDPALTSGGNAEDPALTSDLDTDDPAGVSVKEENGGEGTGGEGTGGEGTGGEGTGAEGARAGEELVFIETEQTSAEQTSAEEPAIEEGPDPETYVPETDFGGDTFIADEEAIEEEFDIIAQINEFLSTVNQITLAVDGDWNQIGSWLGAIDSAIDKFRTTFADSNEHEVTDLFGDSAIVTSYSVSENVRSQVGEATAKVMQTAYERLLAYHFINSVKALNPEGISSSAITPDWAVANEQAIRSVISELASLPQDMWIYNPATHSFEFRDAYSGMNQPVFSGETMNEFLRNAVLSLSSNYMLQEPTEEVPVVSTEGKIWNGNNDNDGGDDFDGGYTAEELAEAIKEQEKNIKETELQIREAELGIKEYKKVLDGKIVYATMDGIVKSAGSVEDTSGNSFITITGKAGLYVKGSVNELALDTVKVGDTITGTSYETGSSFTAEIVEISEYPEESSTSYYGFGDGNTNSSYYPFYAYIDNAEGLQVDSYVDLSLSNTNASVSADPMISGGLSLEEYYVRTDNNGRSYCYVRGKDGLLEKRYLEVGANNWGVITIKSGLTPNDCIAFPYGDGVEEGAQTVEVEYLTAVEGEAY